MIEIKLKKANLVMYESIKELPVTNTHELNKLSFYDLNVGSTPSDYNKHHSKIFNFISSNNIQEAIEEYKNSYRCFYNAINNIGTWSYSFVPYIYSIDGKEYDLNGSMKDYKETIYKLSKAGLTTDVCESTIDELKKKLITNWNPIFLIDMVLEDQVTSILK